MSLPPLPSPPADTDRSSKGGRPPRRPRRGLLVALVAGAIALVVAINQFEGDETATSGSAGVGSASSPASSTESPVQTETPESRQPTSSPAATVEEPQTNATVMRVIDGDTIEVRYKGRILDVRLIGIDTPETVAPGEPVECYGKAASRFTEESLDGERVLLEFDVERTDRYGRTLAYVWIDDELFNETLVGRGLAQVSTFPPNVKYVDVFVGAQREARQADKGLWGSCQAEEEETGGGNGGGGGNCDPSYPSVCIPPFPPDLDCGDVAFTNFQVTGSDPHGFDGDNDGIGCET